MEYDETAVATLSCYYFYMYIVFGHDHEVRFGVGFFDSYDVSKLMEMPRIEEHGTGSVHRVTDM